MTPSRCRNVLGIWLLANIAFCQSFQLLEDLKGYVEQAVDIFQNLKYIENIFDDASEEFCVFLCPNGKKPSPKDSHVPEPNGCGSFGVQLPDDQLPVGELTQCCNKHDICYETCNAEKEECDKVFKQCLYRICDKHKNSIGSTLHRGCKATAKTMYTGTILVGCKAYKDAQKAACHCKTWREL